MRVAIPGVSPSKRRYSKLYKKSELMLTKRAKAYSSSCLQTVSLSPAITSQFILEVCTTLALAQISCWDMATY